MTNKRKSLCIDEKVLLIRAIEAGEKKSDVGRRFGFSRSTVSTIWKNKVKILQAEEDGKSSKKLKKPKYEDLDRAMLSWFHIQRQNNMPVSGPIVKAKAQKFSEKLGITAFKASEGWLGKFKQRHHINYGRINGEARIIDIANRTNSADNNKRYYGTKLNKKCFTMQLILETESAVDISSKMSLEKVSSNKLIINGIVENVTNDVRIDNKENVNKSVNNQTTINDIKATDDTSLVNLPENVIKKEVEDDISSDLLEKHIENNIQACYIDESAINTSNCEKDGQNDKTNLIVENFIEFELNTVSTEKQISASHNSNDTELENTSVKDEEYDTNTITINYENDNAVHTLQQVKQEINVTLSEEINSNEPNASPQLEVNSNIKVENSSEVESELTSDENSLQDQTVKQEPEAVDNEFNAENNTEVSNEGENLLNTILEKAINNLEKSIGPESIQLDCAADKTINDGSENKNSSSVNEVTNTILQKDCTKDIIITYNNNKKIEQTDVETVTVRDDELSKPESMNVDSIDDQDDVSNDNNNEKMDVDTTVDKDSLENLDDSSSSNNAVDSDITKVTQQGYNEYKNEIIDIDDEKSTNNDTVSKIPNERRERKESPHREEPIMCRLSNTLDILSDDEDEPTISQQEKAPLNGRKNEEKKLLETEKRAINIDDDDDIVVIEDFASKAETDLNKKPSKSETGEKSNFMESIELSSVKNTKETNDDAEAKDQNKANEEISEPKKINKPLIADGFLNTAKKKLADMTREELEEFCVSKIVESIVDRSNLSEIKLKLKTMAQSFEEYSKKTMVLYKQNRDLQVVLKSIQEEQKKSPESVVPLKITRSVGMQVLMMERNNRKRDSSMTTLANLNKAKNNSNQPNRTQKSLNNIPVPRLIPANNSSTGKSPTPQTSPSNLGKQAVSSTNGSRVSLQSQKLPEKRALNRSTDCVDLTEDEPPVKIPSRNPVAPVRLVPSQNLLASTRPQMPQTVHSPRKVFIPISSQQGPTIRPGQTFMVKAAGGPRVRGPSSIVPRMPTNPMRILRPSQVQALKHPAPLPDAMKQYQPPNWKALPPAPDLKLAKVDNGIVISWKIEGYQEDSYEDIVSYQLYAYQETSSPPSTALWKKIGDVKALPLPMACTLTQFTSGFKYYFAVRAVDVRSRLGPFSLPGSILLLNKV